MRDNKRGEGGRKGGTAQQKADRLRSKAERLSRQADAWVTNAEREPTIGRRLTELPYGYSVIDDVPVPGSAVRSDHLVVGPGGVYLVDAKKYSGHLVYSGKMLWHGRFPIADKLEAVQWEAACFAEQIGRSVVPVLCFVDTVLPQPVTTLGSVIVCRVSSLMTVVRSSHTMIAATEIARIVAAVTPPAPVDESRGLGTASMAALAIESGARRTDESGTTIEEANAEASDLAAGTKLSIDVDTRPPSSYLSDDSGLPRRPPREPRPRRARRVVGVIALCIVGMVAAAGVVVLFSNWLNSREDKTTATAAATTVAPSTTATPATTTTTTTPPTDAGAQFIAVCPDTRGGWTMVPVWPGTVEGLAWYDYAVQSIPDGNFIEMGLMQTPDAGTLSLTGLGANEKRFVRITPAYRDGTAGEPVYVVVTAPGEVC